MENQLMEFIGHYLQTKKLGADSIFIAKPWNLARGIGHVISDDLNCLIRYALLVSDLVH
jgi:hypothetical protein